MLSERSWRKGYKIYPFHSKLNIVNSHFWICFLKVLPLEKSLWLPGQWQRDCALWSGKSTGVSLYIAIHCALQLIHLNLKHFNWNAAYCSSKIFRYLIGSYIDENCTRPLRCFVWSQKASWHFSLPHSSQNLLLPLLRFVCLSTYIFVCFCRTTVCLSRSACLWESALSIMRCSHYIFICFITFLFSQELFSSCQLRLIFISDSGRGSWGNQCCMETGALFCKMK